MRLLAALLLVLLCARTPASAQAEIAGVPAILPYPYTLSARLTLRAPGPPLERALDLRIVDASQKALRTYDTDMTKKLHLIVVSDDLRTFRHVHPVLGNDGHFRLLLRFPRAVRYHLFADAVPHIIGRTVFRFDVNLGADRAPPARGANARTASAVQAGPYRVALDRTTVFAGSLSMLTVHIGHSGAAPPLHPYLGALAHAVLIGTDDLSYVHAHAMSMESMMKLAELDACEQHTMLARMNLLTLAPGAPVPDEMMIHLTPPRRGRYKLWLQFKGGRAVYAAPFVLNAI